jgi:hypothetical protein
MGWSQPRNRATAQLGATNSKTTVTHVRQISENGPLLSEREPGEKVSDAPRLREVNGVGCGSA